MHLLVRETRSLDEDAPAQEPGQTPAPLLALSFSDADLGALAAAWTPAYPDLRLASLARLRHPMSVDLYLEQLVAHSRCVVIRLLGGMDYWRYGIEETAALCRQKAIPLALLPGDAADDSRLRTLSTIDPQAWSAIDASMREHDAPLTLDWATHLAGKAARPTRHPHKIPQHALLPLPSGEGRVEGDAMPLALAGQNRAAAIILYRSHVLSADTAPIQALATALEARGLIPYALYVPSLKAPDSAAWTEQTLRSLDPAVILNTTAFSARTHEKSPLDAPGCPVLQLVLAGSTREAWSSSARGLSATDLAMQVVLPELDGRLLTTAISFKSETPRHPTLQYARTIHAPHPTGIAQAADRAAAWARLATTPRSRRRLALILSDYPAHPGQQGHAVGLDTFQSLESILTLLATPSPVGSGSGGTSQGSTGPLRPWNAGGGEGACPTTEPAERQDAYATTTLSTDHLTHALTRSPPTPTITLETYRRLLETLPLPLQHQLHAAWGPPEHDPAVQNDAFTLRHLHAGNAVIALQPDRGAPGTRRATYHDPDLPPRHAYVAFHLWLRHVLDVHAIVQLGAHGSLEWLPGKSAALSPACWPQALLGPLPVIYPFIVNNPGEAAAAKRRLGAVTIGHLTPPIGRAPAHGPARTLERLIDEYATADGLDRRRAASLRAEILDQAQSTGLLAEAGAPRDATPDEALARLDAYLCDVKDLLLRDGLHVFGRPPPGRTEILAATGAQATAALDASPAAEQRAFLAALDGRFVQPGPAGAPTRGRLDVLPTGRNLTTIDPRHVPTRAALALAEKAAAALLRRHLQDHGEHPKTIVLDLWGSTTMRTGGEDLALAFILLGARPTWDDASARVSGYEILPLALLDRPRIDVTLRISGLFRDAFATQLTLFDTLATAIAARDEAPDWNPLATQAPRIYGPAPGQYGAGDGTGAGWLAASSTAYGQTPTHDPAGLAARIANADAFLHTQDHAETDLLDSTDTAAHEGGFAQAATTLGADPALYHLDTSTPEAPKPRTVPEEIARIVRGRAANPAWIRGQMRHAHRGAAEIARPTAALLAYAQTLPHRFDKQFDLLYQATLADPDVEAFLQTQNPEAHAHLQSQFTQAQETGLWHPKSNSTPDKALRRRERVG